MLAFEGGWGGNPELIWRAPVNRVLEAYYYKTFQREYESTFYELNKEKK